MIKIITINQRILATKEVLFDFIAKIKNILISFKQRGDKLNQIVQEMSSYVD